ncbi:MAG: hypothetical protein HXS48_05270 [Theionarchaea archaeon]|nr:hypothetical protein [Theionarchaea archaeon]
MDKKKMPVIVASVAFVFLAITCVTASSWTSNTPLYTLRMEQASSKMNFLPTERNTFTYETEGRYVLNSCGYCDGAKPLNPYTCATCDEYYCDNPSLCYGTCYSTCPGTCSTCVTCNTCSGPTCEGTCYPTECPWTQWVNCKYTQVFPTCYWPGC